ncbi:MAG: hypothetical protein LVQ96_07075 [Thermoplasmatales archaeon]|nr:hypothetical protein [Thermoplasmatales archaeon]MCW6170917.1 hypothetical protein [Thermoplasmatales archaeon]
MAENDVDEKRKGKIIWFIPEKNDAIHFIERKFTLDGFVIEIIENYTNNPGLLSDPATVLRSQVSAQEPPIAIIAEGRMVKPVIDILYSKEKVTQKLILIDPKDDGTIKTKLHGINVPTMIISGVPMHKLYVLEHLSFHDLIAGSVIKYIRPVNNSSLENPTKVFNYLVGFIDDGLR